MVQREIDIGGELIGDAGIDLGDLVIDPENFDTSSFDDADFKVVEVGTQLGGEVRTNDQNEEYTTRDSIVLYLEPLSLESDQPSPWNITLPQMGDDGKRRPPHVTGNLAVIIEAFAGLGVSANPRRATVYNWIRPDDWIGLSFHRQRVEKQIGRSKRWIHVPTYIIGMDHDLRKRLSTPNRTLRELDFVPPQ